MKRAANTAAMYPALVVVGWALFNVALIVVLIVFRGRLAETALYGASAALVTVYGAAVLLTAVRERAAPGRQQHRQPVRSSSMFLLGVACMLLAMGSVFHWWFTALALYPLIAALFLRRGERLPRGTIPVPATTATQPAPPVPAIGDLPHHGSSLGESVPLPATHPVRRPPRRRLPRTTSDPGGSFWRLALVILAALRSLVRIRHHRASRVAHRGTEDTKRMAGHERDSEE